MEKINQPERSPGDKEKVVIWKEKIEPLCEVTNIEINSSGVSGSEYIRRLEEKGYFLSDSIKGMLLSLNFNPTDGVAYKLKMLQDLGGGNHKPAESGARLSLHKKNLGLIETHPEVAFMLLDRMERRDLPMDCFFLHRAVNVPTERDGYTVKCTNIRNLYVFDERLFVTEYSDDAEFQFGRGPQMLYESSNE